MGASPHGDSSRRVARTSTRSTSLVPPELFSRIAKQNNPRATRMHARAHAREFFNYLNGSRAVTDRSAVAHGQHADCAYALRANAPGGSRVSSLCSFSNFSFLKSRELVQPLRGQLPPAQRARGGYWLSRERASRP